MVDYFGAKAPPYILHQATGSRTPVASSRALPQGRTGSATQAKPTEVG